jgi:hypothetical protein
MYDTTTDCVTFHETVVLLRYFNDLPDPRQQGKMTYLLDEILLLCQFSVLVGAVAFPRSRFSVSRNLNFYTASARSRMARGGWSPR